jgi:hypothetical protein
MEQAMSAGGRPTLASRPPSAVEAARAFARSRIAPAGAVHESNWRGDDANAVAPLAAPGDDTGRRGQKRGARGRAGRGRAGAAVATTAAKGGAEHSEPPAATAPQTCKSRPSAPAGSSPDEKPAPRARIAQHWDKKQPNARESLRRGPGGASGDQCGGASTPTRTSAGAPDQGRKAARAQAGVQRCLDRLERRRRLSASDEPSGPGAAGDGCTEITAPAVWIRTRPVGSPPVFRRPESPRPSGSVQPRAETPRTHAATAPLASGADPLLASGSAPVASGSATGRASEDESEQSDPERIVVRFVSGGGLSKRRLDERQRDLAVFRKRDTYRFLCARLGEDRIPPPPKCHGECTRRGWKAVFLIWRKKLHALANTLAPPPAAAPAPAGPAATFGATNEMPGVTPAAGDMAAAAAATPSSVPPTELIAALPHAEANRGGARSEPTGAQPLPAPKAAKVTSPAPNATSPPAAAEASPRSASPQSPSKPARVWRSATRRFAALVIDTHSARHSVVAGAATVELCRVGQCSPGRHHDIGEHDRVSARQACGAVARRKAIVRLGAAAVERASTLPASLPNSVPDLLCAAAPDGPPAADPASHGRAPTGPAVAASADPLRAAPHAPLGARSSELATEREAAAPLSGPAAWRVRAPTLSVSAHAEESPLQGAEEAPLQGAEEGSPFRLPPLGPLALGTSPGLSWGAADAADAADAGGARGDHVASHLLGPAVLNSPDFLEAPLHAADSCTPLLATPATTPSAPGDPSQIVRSQTPAAGPAASPPQPQPQPAGASGAGSAAPALPARGPAGAAVIIGPPAGGPARSRLLVPHPRPRQFAGASPAATPQWHSRATAPMPGPAVGQAAGPAAAAVASPAAAPTCVPPAADSLWKPSRAAADERWLGPESPPGLGFARWTRLAVPASAAHNHRYPSPSNHRTPAAVTTVASAAPEQAAAASSAPRHQWSLVPVPADASAASGASPVFAFSRRSPEAPGIATTPPRKVRQLRPSPVGPAAWGPAARGHPTATPTPQHSPSVRAPGRRKPSPFC